MTLIGHHPHCWTPSTFDCPKEAGFADLTADIDFIDRNFTTPIYCRGAKLTHVKGPNVHCKSSSSYNFCDITKIQGDKDITATHCWVQVMTCLESINIDNIDKLQRAFAIKGLNIKDLNGDHAKIESQEEHIRIERATGVSSLKSCTYLNIIDSTVYQAICQPGPVDTRDASIHEIVCNTLTSVRSLLESVQARCNITLTACKIGDISSTEGDIVASNCKNLSEFEAKNITLLPKQTGNISGRVITITDCNLSHNIEGEEVRISHSILSGTISAKNNIIIIFYSRIQNLVMQKPVSFASSPDVSSPEVQELVKHMKLGRLKITPLGSGYQMHYQDPTQGTNQNRTQHNDITVTSNFNYVVTNTIKNKCIITLGNKVNLSADKKIIAEALNAMNSLTRREPQTVILEGGHINRITFTIDGGQVLLRSGAKVDEIVRGSRINDLKNNSTLLASNTSL